MKIERHDSGIRVILSERNLRALLSKLSLPDSACTIYKADDQVGIVYISAESDAQHYADHRPGAMHHDTEAALKDVA